MNSKRRNRKAKARKPKYLSLRLQFPANETIPKTTRPAKMQPRRALTVDAPTTTVAAVEYRENDNQEHENVAYFFDNDDGGATTLTGLLDGADSNNSSHATNKISSRTDDLSHSSPSLTYAYDGESLMRNAFRNKERDSSEDKWVCYSEVVERKVVKEEEVTSTAVDPRPIAYDRVRIQRLSLKLDYQEILNAWPDKGPFYLNQGDDNSSQIVPDINDDFLAHEVSNSGWGCNMGLWTVPNMVGGFDHKGDIKPNISEEFKIGQREASVLRYKEKRRNRLFSKKIRYEVRKLNAQNRPRLKGRFVKKNEAK